MVKKLNQDTSAIEARIELPEHYIKFLHDFAPVFGDLNGLLSRLLIEEINRTHEHLKANSPASISVNPLADLTIGLPESQ
ncbi:Uncharacterised protein [uncultured archaeon]|nr:Uncharacterised protein [uncultured archaeon]